MEKMHLSDWLSGKSEEVCSRLMMDVGKGQIIVGGATLGQVGLVCIKQQAE